MRTKMPISLRILAGLMAVLVIQTVVPWSTLVGATETQPTISVDGTTITISGYTSSSALVTDLQDVSKITQTQREAATKVIISDLTEIDSLQEYTSNSATNATRWSVMFPGMTTLDLTGSTFTALPNRAFRKNTVIQRVYLPATLTKITAMNTFDGCKNLVTVSCDNTETDAVVDLSGLTNAEGHANALYAWFSGCTKIESIVWAPNMTSIGQGAFQGCTGLTSVVIPEGVKSIGNGTFTVGLSGSNAKATTLVVELPSTIETIHANSFGRSTGMTIAYHGTGADAIANTLLTALQGQTLPAYIHLDLSGSDVSKTILTTMAETATNYNTFLLSLNVANTSLAANDLVLESAQQTVWNTLGDKVVLSGGTTESTTSTTGSTTSITESTTSTTQSTTSTTESTTSTTESTTSTTEPTTSTTGSTTTTIQTAVITVDGNDVIATVDNVTSLDEVKSAIGTALATYNSDNNTTYALADVTTMILSTPNGAEFAGVYAHKTDLPSLKKVDLSNVVFQDNTLGVSNTITSLEEVILPEGLVVIPKNAFYNCSSLKELNIPSTVKEIGDAAFTGTALTDITLPNGLITLGRNVFQGSTKLSVPSTNGIMILPDTLTIFGTEEKSTNPTQNNATTNISRYTFHNIGISGLEYHGAGNDAFFTNLVGALRFALKSTTPLTYLDLSGSGITHEHIALFPNGFMFLNITDCANIDQSDPDFIAYVKTMQDRGGKVLGLNNNGGAEVVVMASPSVGGVVSGDASFTKKELPATVTLTATPNQVYTFTGWIVGGKTYPAGEPDIRGTYSLTLDIEKSIIAFAQFERKPQGVANLSATITVQDDDVIATVKDAVKWEDVTTAITAALEAYNAEKGTSLKDADITKLVLSTPENTEYSGKFIDNELYPNMTKYDLSNLIFENSIITSSGVYKNEIITEIVLPEGLRTLGKNSFYGCTNLAVFNIPSTVTVIESSVLSTCPKIPYLVLPEGLISLGANFGQGCSGITRVGETEYLYDIPDGLQIWGSPAKSTDPKANDVSVNFSRLNFHNMQVKAVEYHGKAPAAFYVNLIGALNISGAGAGGSSNCIESIDLSNTTITEEELVHLKVRKTITYLNIKGCPIDYTTARGKILTDLIEQLIANGTEVEYDEGIIRVDDTPTFEMETTVKTGQTLAEALQAAIDAYNNGKEDQAAISDITILKVTTAEGVELTLDDFTFLRTQVNALRVLDLSETKVSDNKIPNDALYQLEKMHTFVFPPDVTEIGSRAFALTGLKTITLPENLEVIGAEAFAYCYNLSGSLYIPHTVRVFYNGSFTQAMFTSLEYHGSADMLFTNNFSGSYVSLQYLDLRGNTALSEVTFVTSIELLTSLKEAHLDYCSIDQCTSKGHTLTNTFQNARAQGVIITRHNQFKPFDLSKLSEPIKGKSDDESNYPPFKSDEEEEDLVGTTTESTTSTTTENVIGDVTTEAVATVTTTTQAVTDPTTSATTTMVATVTTTTQAVTDPTTSATTTTLATQPTEDNPDIPGTGVSGMAMPIALLLLAAFAGMGLTLKKRKAEGEGR